MPSAYPIVDIDVKAPTRSLSRFPTDYAHQQIFEFSHHRIQ